MRRLAITSLALAAALAVGACSSGSTPSPSQAASSPSAETGASPSAATGASPSAAAGGVTATIKDFKFDPATIQAKVGDTITWTNQDSVAHTVTLDDGSVDSKDIENGKTFAHAFTTAGTFAYHCAIHSSMKGTITVS